MLANSETGPAESCTSVGVANAPAGTVTVTFNGAAAVKTVVTPGGATKPVPSAGTNGVSGGMAAEAGRARWRTPRLIRSDVETTLRAPSPALKRNEPSEFVTVVCGAVLNASPRRTARA